MATPKLFTVVYRTGGFARFSWARTLPVQTLEEALALKASIELGGRVALAPQDWARSLAVGLPETFEVEAGR